jgi:hypothetical protein
MCVISPYIIGAAIVVSVAGTAYNVYAGQQAAGAAKKAQKKADAAASALSQLSTEQWDNYKNNYKPVVEEYVDQATKPVNQQEMANAAVVDSTQNLASQIQGIPLSMTAAGIGAGSERSKDAAYGIANQVSLSGAADQLTARDKADDLQFNRRMGAATTGRGIPGDVMAGYGSLAERFQNHADKWNAKAQGNYNQAGQFTGQGMGIGMGAAK